MIKPPLGDPRGGFLLSFSSVLTGCDIKLSFSYFCSDAVYQGFYVSLGGVNTQYHELVTAYAVYTMLTLCGFPETVA